MSRLRTIIGIILIGTLVPLGLSVTFTILELRETTLDVNVAKDDIVWPVQQIEVETQQLLAAALQSRLTPVSLPNLELRYAILLSRTDLFKYGDFQLEIAKLPKSNDILQQIIRDTEQLAPLVNNALNGNTLSLSVLLERTRKLQSLAHSLTLQLNRDRIQQVIDNREQLSSVFASTEILLGVLALTAFAGFVFLYLMIKQAEKNRAEAEFHQRRAEANSEAKSRFLSNMSHELRTPLNAIMGFTQLMKMDKGELSPEHLSNIDEIYVASEHLLTLISDILELSKIESGQLGVSLEPCAIIPLLQECFNLIAGQAQHRDISLHLPTTRLDYYLKVDHTRLKQVLTNFLTNAIKYNRPGGWVKVELQRRSRDNHLRIEVIDNGIGIRKSDQTKVFRPFERLAEDVTIEGTGIGLALSQQLVYLMGGKIGFRSTEGEGSQFWVEFPVHEVISPPEGIEATGSLSSVASHPSPSHPSSKQQAVTRNKTVLYVDDNQTNLELLQRYFAGIPHLNLITVTNAEQGLRAVTRARPDLVLLDLNLPKTSGFEFYQQLKTSLSPPYPPVIAATANITAQEEADKWSIEFDRLITKPFSLLELSDILDEYLDISLPC